MAKFPRGSEWRRWDLHVHTPSSIVQQYGGDNPAAWDAYVSKLASLPPDISVLAITDYLFVDGYEKLLARRNEFPNIELLLANVEFRLNTFSGTENSNKRHNFHVIFDASVTPAKIREQLLNSMSMAYRLDDRSEWNQTPTTNSLIELGQQMKARAPSGNAIKNKSDLQAGFESITYKREDILRNLEKDCFKGKCLIGIGYSEWDQSRWDQAAATKRDLINQAHFALTSNDDVDKIAEHVADLERNKLNSLVLHSSDSHSVDRLGQTKLWIKAELPKLPEADAKSQNELAALLALKKQFEDQIVIRKRIQEQINALQTRVKVFSVTHSTFMAELAAALSSLGIVNQDAFKSSFDPGPMQTALQQRIQEVQAEIDQLRSGTRAQSSALMKVAGDSWTFENYESLSAVVEKKTAETKAFETEKLKYQQQKARIVQLTATIEALEKELAAIGAVTAPEFEAVQKGTTR